jgi:molybdopterin molybdotransferase
MRPFKDTIPLQQAIEIVLQAAVPIERRERVRIGDASGRVVASAVHASDDVPPFDRAMMDGYAVIAGGTAGGSQAGPARLRVVQTIYTGQIPQRAVGPGECAEIATGAPMPAGADAVVMVEDTARDGDEVLILKAVNARQNVGSRGADLAAGQAVLQPGDVLTPSRLGALAATGAGDVEVYARPAVAIVSTGNEIVEPGRPLGPGQIYDINRYTLAAIASAHGGDPIVLPAAADALDDLTAVADRAADADLAVFSGGSSVGDRDLTLDVLRACGEVLFHGVAVKPGKPTAFGRLRGTPVLGMPGNPTSCLSNAYVLLIPLLRRIARLPDFQPRVLRLPLARRITSTPGRHQIYTVRLAGGAAHPAFKSSGDITSMSQADGYIEIPDGGAVEEGERVEVTLF